MANKENNNVKRKDIIKVMWRYILTFQWSWNYERMQALGFAWSIMPVLKKVYTTKEDLIEAVKSHMNFFNVNPATGGTIIGASAAMEEKGAKSNAVNSLKTGLMGPFSGIGDTLMGVLARPLLGVYAASMAMAGNIGGFWLMFLGYGVLWGIVIKYALFWVGYNEGINVVGEVAGEDGKSRIDKITDYATIFGITVVGGFIPSILNVTTPVEFTRNVEVQGEMTEKVVKLQSVFDELLPNLIPILLVGVAYFLLQKLDWSPIKVLLTLIIIGFGGSVLGIL